jgi:hypothetical protein
MTRASTTRLPPLSDLHNLEDGPEVLSAYVALKPGRNTEHGHSPEIMNALRPLRDGLDGEQRKRFEHEADRVVNFVRNELPPHGRTLVVFASEPRGIWQTLTLQIELPTMARFEPKPYLVPLERDATLERIAIVQFDKEQARLLTTRLGAIEEDRRLRDYLPRKSRRHGMKHQKADSGPGYGSARGGAPSFKEDASLDEWIREHLDKTLDALDELQDKHPFSRIVLAGTTENLARFEENLPNDLRDKLSGRIATDIDDTAENILEQALTAVRESRAVEDQETVERVLNFAAAGGLGRVGWDAVFRAFQEGRVHELILLEDVAREGARCPDGHYLAVNKVPCPICGKAPEVVPDLSDAARDLAEATSAFVRTVSGNAAETLRRQGEVAALLRY